jgi:prepilin-type N-terminal cleavage/methylation domain-containing protein
MQRKLKSMKQDGFTIIEVMIVLAIAGLIMLIVFLAVPALQRNARNTTRQNDAARMAAAVNECITNNNGRVDECGNDFSAEQLSNYYDLLDNQQLTDQAAAVGGVSGNDFFFDYNFRCDDTGTAPEAGGGSRAFVIAYEIETAEDNVGRCIGS